MSSTQPGILDGMPTHGRILEFRRCPGEAPLDLMLRCVADISVDLGAPEDATPMGFTRPLTDGPVWSPPAGVLEFRS